MSKPITNKPANTDIINSGLFFRKAFTILKNPLEFLAASVKNNGPVVKLNLAGKKYFLVQHPKYIKQVLLDNNKIYNKVGHKLGKMFLGESLATSNGESWARKRRIMSPAFAHQKLEGMVAGINEETSSFIDRLGKANMISPVNITNELRLLTMSIISRTMFNTPLAEIKDVIKLLQELTTYSTKHMKSLIKIPFYWPTPSNRHYRKNVRLFDEIIYGIIKKRKTDRADPAGSKHNDMLDLLLDHCDKETGAAMTDKFVRDELTTMLIAGHETTTQALSWTIFQMAKNKEILFKVRSEGDSVIGDRFPAYPTISKLLYTRQVVCETLRYYPPLWLLVRKNIKDDNLNGFHVPSGSTVLINLYGLHRHPAYWDNPDIFNPDRFDKSFDESRHSFVFIPFSVAPRSCIGDNFAMLEMMIVINRIVRMFDFEVPVGYVPKIEPDISLKARGGIQLKVKKSGQHTV